MSVWRWIALLVIAWAAPPLIARTARALSWRQKRKKECPHLQGRVKELLQAEFPEVTVDSPITPFSWFTDPELSAALVTPTVFAYVVPAGQVHKRELEYVARYGGVVGAVDLRVYTHDPAASPNEIIVNDRTISMHGVRGCGLWPLRAIPPGCRLVQASSNAPAVEVRRLAAPGCLCLPDAWTDRLGWQRG